MALVSRFAVLALLLAVPRGAAASDSAAAIDRWSSQVHEASVRFDIPEQWIRKVMSAESGGRTKLNGRPITSPAGAMGPMQLMPGTWADMREAYGLGANPYDPHVNVLAGAAYLRLMYDRFGYPGLFAAYNAGPGRYREHLTSRRSLPPETIVYVGRIVGAKRSALTLKIAGSRRTGSLSGLNAATDTQSAGTPSRLDALFAIRR